MIQACINLTQSECSEVYFAQMHGGGLLVFPSYSQVVRKENAQNCDVT